MFNKLLNSIYMWHNILNDSNTYIHLKNFCKQNIGLQQYKFSVFLLFIYFLNINCLWKNQTSLKNEVV